MSIAEKDGKILFHCHAGCSQENVIATLRSRGLWPKRGSVMEDRRVTIDENEGEREAKEKQFRHLVSLWRAMALTSQKPAKYLKGRGLGPRLIKSTKR